MSQKAIYTQLSKERQNYSNAVLKYLNIEVKLIGDIPKKDHMLYAINHRSLLDIIVMEHIFSRYNKSGIWIAKQELFDAIYGDFFRYSGCISVDLEEGKGLIAFFKKIKMALAKVDNLNVYIFPEGERYGGEGVLKFQSGASKIARANKLEIVPVFINDKLERVFKDAPFRDTKVVEVHVGELVEYKNLQERYTEFIERIKQV
jgi:1-acyl-sn-glycerol-3-phosphate acyltransferase